MTYPRIPRLAIWTIWMAVIVLEQTTTLAFLSSRWIPVQSVYQLESKSLSAQTYDSTTLEGFGKFLSELLTSQHDEEDQKQLLTTRFDTSVLLLNRTIAQPSTIRGAGMGLFATQDYPNGTLLTCYPGDALVELNDDDHDDHDDDESVTWGKHTEHLDTTSISLQQEYMLRAVRDDWGILAIPPVDSNWEDASYLGHLANDGATQLPTCEQDLAPYVLQSASKANAEHKCLYHCHMVTVATDDIVKGDEIFVTYGPDYWRAQDSFVPDTDDNNKLLWDNIGEEDDDFDFVIDSEEYVEEYDDYYEDQADSIVHEIISSEDTDESSTTRGMGFG